MVTAVFTAVDSFRGELIIMSNPFCRSWTFVIFIHLIIFPHKWMPKFTICTEKLSRVQTCPLSSRWWAISWWRCLFTFCFSFFCWQMTPLNCDFSFSWVDIRSVRYVYKVGFFCQSEIYVEVRVRVGTFYQLWLRLQQQKIPSDSNSASKAVVASHSRILCSTVPELHHI